MSGVSHNTAVFKTRLLKNERGILLDLGEPFHRLSGPPTEYAQGIGTGAGSVYDCSYAVKETGCVDC